jgi:hypothetical protein
MTLSVHVALNLAGKEHFAGSGGLVAGQIAGKPTSSGHLAGHGQVSIQASIISGHRILGTLHLINHSGLKCNATIKKHRRPR